MPGKTMGYVEARPLLAWPLVCPVLLTRVTTVSWALAGVAIKRSAPQRASASRANLLARSNGVGRAGERARGSGWGRIARGIHGRAARVAFAPRRSIRFTRFEMFN